jgi:hypothetical protein
VKAVLAETTADRRHVPRMAGVIEVITHAPDCAPVRA